MTGPKTWTEICDAFSDSKTGDQLRIIAEQFQEKPIEERVEFTYKLYNEGGLFSRVVKQSPKNAELAAGYRQVGNRHLCEKQPIEAVKLYTEGVSVAPPDSDELALSFGNRSAASFLLKKYVSSLIDVNRSLKIAACPEYLKPKLFRRKNECIAKINEDEAMKSVCKILRPKSSPTESASQSDDVPSFDTEISDVTYDWRFPLPTVDSTNELLPNTSAKLQLHHTEEYGVHMIATQDIMPGELLFTCPPAYVSVLSPEYYHTHCNNCFVRSDILIPCETCSVIMFCGENCRNEAVDRFHRMECEVLTHAMPLDRYREELMALRALMIVTKQSTQLIELMEHPVFKDPFVHGDRNLTQKFDPDDYGNLYRLENHFEKAAFVVQLERAAMAAVLVHLLKFSSFFDDAYQKSGITTVEPRLDWTEHERYVGNLLLKILFALENNQQAMRERTELEIPTSLKDPLMTTTTSIGCGLYPLVCLLNHSCDANVVKLSYKTSMAVYAILPIAAGEQLFDNYGCHYLVEPRDTRQTYLRDQFFFECVCPPCVEDWPNYNNLPRENPQLISRKLKIEKLKKSCKRFKMLAGQSEAGAMVAPEFKFFCKHLKMLNDSIKKPWWEHAECQEFIKRILEYYADNRYSITNQVY